MLRSPKISPSPAVAEKYAPAKSSILKKPRASTSGDKQNDHELEEETKPKRKTRFTVDTPSFTEHEELRDSEFEHMAARGALAMPKGTIHHRKDNYSAKRQTRKIVKSIFNPQYNDHREKVKARCAASHACEKVDDASPQSHTKESNACSALQMLGTCELFDDSELQKNSAKPAKRKSTHHFLLDKVLESELEEPAVRETLTFAETAHNFITGTYWSALSGILTVLSLYIPDLQQACMPKESDDFVLDGLLTFMYFFFFIDLIANSYARYDYCNSFFFWLDVIGVISMTTDIPWMVSFLGFSNGGLNVAKGGRAGRAAKSAGGAKFMTKLLRMMKMTKFTRLVKMLFLATHDQEMENPCSTDISKIGSQLADKTSKKVIIGVLFMFITVPLLAVDVYNPTTIGHELRFLEHLHSTLDQSSFLSGVQEFLDNHKSDQIIFLQYDDVEYLSESTSHLRPAEIYEENTIAHWKVSFNIKSIVGEECWLNIVLTSVVVCLFAVGAAAFSHDATTLVVEPLERTIKIITDLARTTFWLSAAENNSWTIEQCDALEEELIKNILVKIGVIFKTLPVDYGMKLRNLLAPNIAMIHTTLFQTEKGNTRQNVFQGLANLDEDTGERSSLLEKQGADAVKLKPIVLARPRLDTLDGQVSQIIHRTATEHLLSNADCLFPDDNERATLINTKCNSIMTVTKEQQ